MAEQERPGVLREAGTGRVIAARVWRPSAAVPRLLGLLVRPPLGAGEALWLDPCGGIHTWRMRYSLDVVFLDRDLRVLRVVGDVRPWGMVFAPRTTRSVVEFPAGGASGVARGMRLEYEEG